nr:hypothetical protein [Tanacetum cinerariifolium]
MKYSKGTNNDNEISMVTWLKKEDYGVVSDDYEGPLIFDDYQYEEEIVSGDVGKGFLENYQNFQEEENNVSLLGVVLEEEPMPIYDTYIEDVNEVQEEFFRQRGFGEEEEDNIKDVVVVANDLCSSMIQTTLSGDFSKTRGSSPHELSWLQKGNLVEVSILIDKKYQEEYLKDASIDDKFDFETIKVKEYQEKDKIGSKPDKNGKRDHVSFRLKNTKRRTKSNQNRTKTESSQKPRRKQRKEAETSHDESEDEDHVPTPFSDPLSSGEHSSILNELMLFCTSLQEQSRSRGLRRLKRFGSVRRVKSPMEKDGLGAQENASKQGMMIEEIDQNVEIALDDETRWRTNDDEMFRVDDLAGEEVVMDSAAEPVTTVKDGAAPTTDVTEDEITMAQALVALKGVKPKVVVQEQEMSTTIPVAATIVTTDVPTPRAKLHARERKEFSEEQKARLKKHFTALRDQEKRSKPPTKTQMKSQMSTYLRHMGGYKQSHLKGRSFDEIKELFDREMTKVNNFIAMDLEARESSTKRTAKHLESDISNKKREDLEVLWAIVKDRFKKKKPVDDMDNILFRTLKTMSEHHVEDTIWNYQQGLAKVKNWKLFESCGVDYDVEMAYDLLRFIRKQLMESYTLQ